MQITDKAGKKVFQSLNFKYFQCTKIITEILVVVHFSILSVKFTNIEKKLQDIIIKTPQVTKVS